MPYDVNTLTNLEEALSECFAYHNQLDAFVTRAGVNQEVLFQARQQAEERASQSTSRSYSRAPKRLVVQELFKLLSASGADGDRVFAALVTGIVRGTFPECTANATSAIDRLRSQIQDDREEKERRRQEQEASEQHRRREVEKAQEAAYLKAQQERDALQARFLTLMGEIDAQFRGYEFEKFLNDLFTLEGLTPRQSFRTNGEQIDGAFSWRGRTHLVEAKWVKNPIAGSEFGAFSYKIDGKTADTRGLYISVNGYSPQAVRGLNSKGALKFVCICGTHLLRSLAVGQSLPKILDTIWRHADETGEAYFETSRFNS